MISICGNDALRELSSPGKSGSFFYLTNDDRYMIKTMKKAEVKVSFIFFSFPLSSLLPAPFGCRYVVSLLSSDYIESIMLRALLFLIIKKSVQINTVTEF